MYIIFFVLSCFILYPVNNVNKEKYTDCW